jgi:hypothetical protein
MIVATLAERSQNDQSFQSPGGRGAMKVREIV